MPKLGLVSETKLQTRNAYTKVDAEISLVVNGPELPNMEVLGRALEKAVTLIQGEITDSYKVVPPRTDTQIAEPFSNKAKVPE